MGAFLCVRGRETERKREEWVSGWKWREVSGSGWQVGVSECACMWKTCLVHLTVSCIFSLRRSYQPAVVAAGVGAAGSPVLPALPVSHYRHDGARLQPAANHLPQQLDHGQFKERAGAAEVNAGGDSIRGDTADVDTACVGGGGI